MNGTIVCAVTDSEGADAAVRVAARLAERFGSRVVLVNVAESFGVVGQEGGFTTARAQEGARRLIERLASDHDLAGRGEGRVEIGPPIETLAAVAAEEAAELIVVGARRGLRRRTLQSKIARELAATAVCPVVVAPPENALGSPGSPRPLALGA